MMVSPQISGDIESAVVDSHAVLSPAPLCGMPTETVGVQQLFPWVNVVSKNIRYVINLWYIIIYIIIYIYHIYIYIIYIYIIYIYI